MPLHRDEIDTVLSELIALNKDSAKGFARAENDVEDESLADLFDRLSADRADLVDDLQRAADRLGQDPEEESTTTGTLARGWLNIKAAMTIEHDKTDAIVLEDRLDHEDDVLTAYEEALSASYPPPITALLQEQQAQIKQVRDKLSRQRAAIEEQL
jgi:uncharacterized protein (TIGR02284 family)